MYCRNITMCRPSLTKAVPNSELQLVKLNHCTGTMRDQYKRKGQSYMHPWRPVWRFVSEPKETAPQAEKPRGCQLVSCLWLVSWVTRGPLVTSVTCHLSHVIARITCQTIWGLFLGLQGRKLESCLNMWTMNGTFELHSWSVQTRSVPIHVESAQPWLDTKVELSPIKF